MGVMMVGLVVLGVACGLLQRLPAADAHGLAFMTLVVRLGSVPDLGRPPVSGILRGEGLGVLLPVRSGKGQGRRRRRRWRVVLGGEDSGCGKAGIHCFLFSRQETLPSRGIQTRAFCLPGRMSVAGLVYQVPTS